jgi:hypothetical protein
MGVIEKRDARKRHVEGHVEMWKADLAALQKNLRDGFNLHVSYLQLSSYAEASAMKAWFCQGDIELFGQWAYAVAQLNLNGYLKSEEFTRGVYTAVPILHRHAMAPGS